MTVSLEEFKKIELRTAKIVAVEEVPGADRLWKLTLDTGAEPKTIVAGIKTAYPREALLGKTIVLVNNLEPAVIRGVESRGMLLAAKGPERLTLLTVDADVPAGSLIG
jgi:methionyl-tRNA synthetase